MQKLKTVLLPILLGILVLGIMLVTMLKITIDFRIVLGLTSTLLLISGFLSANRKLTTWGIVLIIGLPFSAVFDVVIYSQIPQLIWFTPFFLVATWIGVSIRRKPTKINYGMLIAFVTATTFIALHEVPKLLENKLSETHNESVDPFTIIDMEGNKIQSTDLKGKVVILDFFGTWCRPCIQELVELNKIHQEFANENDVVFFVINTAEAGDTIEKMNKFINKHDYPFNFAFDVDQALVDQFDLYGVPYLFIFDKEGRSRFVHVGYNQGESNFVKTVTGVIEGLR